MVYVVSRACYSRTFKQQTQNVITIFLLPDRTLALGFYLSFEVGV